MAQKIYIVDGRQFRTEADYNRAMHDKEIIEKLRLRMDTLSVEQLKQLKKELQTDKYRFATILGRDFQEELEERIEEKSKKQAAGHFNKQKSTGKITKKSTVIDDYVKDELKRREKRRKRMLLLCSLTAAACLGYVGVYYYYDYRTENAYEELIELKERPVVQDSLQIEESSVGYTPETEKEVPEVLDEYKNLLNVNKKLIGWIKIADTYIDYPVMQTTDNEYYLDHNINQEYDKNGSIFMDKDCDVLKPSTNFILYGHHMKSGKMFGNLDLYSEESYYEEHPYIEFDTIYEKSTYQVMYVFRSRVYSEEEIVFKYYQFIDANSQQEFDSYMQEMAAMSYYNTGVSAEFGDQLLTLSTCDYQEKDGRFVVVAKKIK